MYAMADIRRPEPSARRSQSPNELVSPNANSSETSSRQWPASRQVTSADVEKMEPAGGGDSTSLSDSTTTAAKPSSSSKGEQQQQQQRQQSPESTIRLNELSPFRTAVFNFSSQWFLIPQGTGITSVVLLQLESRFPGLNEISYLVWAFTALSLLVMLIVYAARLAMSPRRVLRALGTDPAELACLSSVSIAFTSIIQMTALTAASSSSSPGGSRTSWAVAAVALWWANAALAVPSMLFIPFAVAHVHSPGISALAPSTQLPMVAAITLAAGGAVVAGSEGLDASASASALRVPVLLFGYFSLALAIPIAMAYATMYLVRLVDGASPPAKGKVYQEMIFCGPWGQGSFALQALGHVLVAHAGEVAAYMVGGGDSGEVGSGSMIAVVTEEAVRVFGYSSVFMGFVSWSAGTFWWAFAVKSTARHLAGSWIEAWKRRRAVVVGEEGEERERYSLAVWALVFPWGVYTNAAIQLGKLLNARFFKVWSTVLTVCLVVLMVVNLVLTAKGLWTGRLLGIERRRRRRLASGKIPPLYT